MRDEPICECGNNLCDRGLPISWDKYRELDDQRGNKPHFFKNPACPLAEHEVEITRTDTYVIVEEKCS